ncbi:MAG: metallophosphoesterase [Archangium sp.]|nr:metallophosphoesterase [Archangium sp.]
MSSVAAQAATRTEHGFKLDEVELIVEGLDPAHDGMRVCQISDIHIGMCTPEKRVLGAIATINALQPDLAVLTGDFVTYSRSPLPSVGVQLDGLKVPTVAVLGNHDHFVDPDEVTKSLDRCGYAVLRNQHAELRVRGVRFNIFGVDDGGTRNDDVHLALDGAPTSGSRLMLTHNPLTVRKLPKDEGLTVLSGHTHGGQIVLGPVTDAISTALGQPYIRGRYLVGGNQLYVNRGLGFGRESDFLHHGSEPELTLFTLRSPEAFGGIGR